MAKILVVDDQQSVLIMLERNLTRMGYAVVLANSGEEALRVLAKEPISLVLLDHMMPDMDGLEVFEHMLKGDTKRPPVIMATAHGSLHLAVSFMRAGGSDFIQKPFDLEVLNLKIDQAIKRWRLENRLFETQMKLEAMSRANIMKDEFLATMSHEIRTPLSSVIGYATLIPECINSNETEDIERYSKSITRSAEQVQRIIDRILDYSKIEAGMLELHRSAQNPGGLVQDAISQVSYFAESKGVNIKTEINENIPEIQVDQLRAIEVLTNLISNAVKFSPEGGNVIIRVSLSNREVLFRVSDEGRGISDDDQKFLFNHFHQVGRSEAEQQGTGLGLAISKKLVELHGGNIGVKSKVGEGCEFYFTLPNEKAV